MDVVRQNSEEKRLSMNVKRTKTMVVCGDETPDVRIVVNGQVLEQVKKFKYLDQWITEIGRCEIKNWIETAKSTFIKMRDVLTSQKLHLEIRKRLVRCLEFPSFCMLQNYGISRWRMKSMHLQCGFSDACSGYHIWTERLL